MPLRIVHLVAPAAVGGIETVVRLLARGQTHRGHEVTVVATVGTPDHPYLASLAEDGIAVAPVVVGSRAYRRERREVSTVFTQTRPQVVHMHGFRPDVIHGDLARSAGAATITTLHGFTPRNWKVRLYEALQLRAARRASAAVAVSAGVADRLKCAGLEPARIHLIRNAYTSVGRLLDRTDAREFLRIPPGSLAVGWLGRFSSEKGPDVAIDAFARIADVRADLFFLGSGADEAAMRARGDACGIGDRIHMLGVVPGAGRLLKAFDVLLLSSRTEGTPMVILEAMAAGTPIVATAVGGVPDVLDEDVAWLAPSEDAHALAEALRTALTDHAEAEARSARASAVLRARFSVDHWLDRHDALYASLVR